MRSFVSGGRVKLVSGSRERDRYETMFRIRLRSSVGRLFGLSCWCVGSETPFPASWAGLSFIIAISSSARSSIASRATVLRASLSFLVTCSWLLVVDDVDPSLSRMFVMRWLYRFAKFGFASRTAVGGGGSMFSS